MTVKFGFIPKNEEVTTRRFQNVVGRKPFEGLVYFNQNSYVEFDNSIEWITALGEQMKNQGISTPYWNLPFPGPQQLEKVADGTFAPVILKALRSILKRYDPSGTAPIPLRLPWEANLKLNFQSNAAVNAKGVYDPKLYIAAFRVMAGLARATSPRFLIDWCTNIGREECAPDLLYPGDDVVDIISQDWYFQDWMQSLGWTFDNVRDMPFGVQWGADFAALHGKPYGWTEYGARGDFWAGELRRAHAWAKQVPHMRHAHIWDRRETIDCEFTGLVNDKPLIRDTYITTTR